MKSLPLKVQICLLIVVSAAVLLATIAFPSLQFTLSLVLQLGAFSLAIFIADLYPIVLPTEGNAEVTVSGAFHTAVAIILGPHAAIVVTLLGTLLAEITLRRTWYKALFNVAELTITAACMGIVYEALHDGARMPFHSLQNAAAVVCMVLTDMLANSGLVTLVVSFATGASFVHVWKANFRDSVWNNLTIIPLGAVMASLWLYQPWSIFAVVLPLFTVRRSFQYIGELREQTQEALIKMADAIDQRDRSTYRHSQRVAAIAEQIAQEMGLPIEDTKTIRMAARLHDLGKIGMSNVLLLKPGKLEKEEVAKFREHPALGAELLKSFRLFEEGQELILHHHERYDGTGYPTGLPGEEIPLGSRVLAVADSFDAMISWRVYRSPLSLNQAIEELITNKGTQFDPEIVDLFLSLLQRKSSKIPLPASAYSREMILS